MPLSVLRGDRAPGEKWLESDGDLAVALERYEADLCGGCGQPLSESTSSDADPNDRDATYVYKATGPVRCYGCDAAAQKAHDHSGGGQFEIRHPQALKYGTRREKRPSKAT